jgi:hypothetical protein
MASGSLERMELLVLVLAHPIPFLQILIADNQHIPFYIDVIHLVNS